MIKRLVIAVILLGLVVGGIVWFKYFRDEMIAQYLSGMTPAPTPVGETVVQPVTWEPTVEAIGTALAARGVDVAIESGGLVRQINFSANDRVTEGQQLILIDDDSEKASLAAAQAALRLAQADAGRAQTLSDRGVGATTTLESAQAQVESARAQLAQAQTALDRRTLTAPFSGVIGIPRLKVGEYVATGQAYATLQDLSQLNVDFSVPEQQLGLLALGGAIIVTTEVGDFSATGKITGIEPRVDPNTRLVLARAEVENLSGALLPGQFLRVRVLLPKEEGVIAVPQSAVSSTLYGDSIFVIRAGESAEDLSVEQVFVKLGRRSGGQIEVVEGLQAGDRIVTSGQNRLTSGNKVRIDNSVPLTVSSGE